MNGKGPLHLASRIKVARELNRFNFSILQIYTFTHVFKEGKLTEEIKEGVLKFYVCVYMYVYWGTVADTPLSI